MKIDPRSDRTVLYYTGDESGEPSVSGVPARDLHENDIARLVYIERSRIEPETDPESGEPLPVSELSGAAYESVVDALVDRLTDGPYRRTDPAKDAPRGTSAPHPKAAPPADSAEGEVA